MYCSLSFQFLSDSSGTAVIFCFKIQAFRDALLQRSLVTSGNLRYCCLSISSNQSSHPPLTSGINKAFSPRTAAQWIFSLFRTILWRFCMEIPVDQQFLKYSDQPFWHQQLCHKNQKIIPHSDAQFELQLMLDSLKLFLKINSLTQKYVTTNTESIFFPSSFG